MQVILCSLLTQMSRPCSLYLCYAVNECGFYAWKKLKLIEGHLFKCFFLVQVKGKTVMNNDAPLAQQLNTLKSKSFIEELNKTYETHSWFRNIHGNVFLEDQKYYKSWCCINRKDLLFCRLFLSWQERRIRWFWILRPVFGVISSRTKRRVIIDMFLITGGDWQVGSLLYCNESEIKTFHFQILGQRIGF